MKKKILVIDDDEFHRELLGRMLAQKGYQVILTEEVMDALLHLPSDEIGMILTDIEMPTVNGLQLLKFLIRKHIPIPVVLLSAHSGTGVQLMGEEMGAAGYLTKPVDQNRLNQIIDEICL